MALTSPIEIIALIENILEKTKNWNICSNDIWDKNNRLKKSCADSFEFTSDIFGSTYEGISDVGRRFLALKNSYDNLLGRVKSFMSEISHWSSAIDAQIKSCKEKCSSAKSVLSSAQEWRNTAANELATAKRNLDSARNEHDMAVKHHVWCESELRAAMYELKCAHDELRSAESLSDDDNGKRSAISHAKNNISIAQQKINAAQTEKERARIMVYDAYKKACHCKCVQDEAEKQMSLSEKCERVSNESVSVAKDAMNCAVSASKHINVARAKAITAAEKIEDCFNQINEAIKTNQLQEQKIEEVYALKSSAENFIEEFCVHLKKSESGNELCNSYLSMINSDLDSKQNVMRKIEHHSINISFKKL